MPMRKLRVMRPGEDAHGQLSMLAGDVPLTDGMTTRLAETDEQAQRRQQVESGLKLAVQVVFSYWQSRMQKPRAILDAKRFHRLSSRLRENGGDVSELLHVVDGALRDEWLMGRDPRAGRKYDGIETIFRDREQVERLFELAPHKNHEHPFLGQQVPK